MSLLKFAVKREHPAIDCGNFMVVFPKGKINRLRTFIGKLILPRVEGVLVVKKPPEENQIPQSLLEYARNARRKRRRSKDTSFREDTHDRG